MRKAPPPPPRFTKAPSFPVPGLTSHFDKLTVDIAREVSARIAKIEPVDSILLMSPNGTVYKVTVSDAGVLATEQLAS